MIAGLDAREPVKTLADLPEEDPIGASRFVEEEVNVFVKQEHGWISMFLRPGTQEPDKCICDITGLMRNGCTCGHLEREQA